MRDRIIEDQIRREQEPFIRPLKEEKGETICVLASSYHDGNPCTTEFLVKKKTFKAAGEYIQALVKLGHDRLVMAEDPDMWSLEVARRVSLAHNEFYKHVLTRWQWRTKSKPLVLMHGDLTLRRNNLL
ncbi:hypothetical protein CEP53_011302 [Fusarium sp. AF-6]|nr:hypothetical protein CEP53_011302 [Fusarium sp. AF-6]